MITRLYKVTDDANESIYFHDKKDAESARYNGGVYVSCFIDSKRNTYHELQHKFRGNLKDGPMETSHWRVAMGIQNWDRMDNTTHKQFLKLDPSIAKLKGGVYCAYCHYSIKDQSGYNENYTLKLETDRNYHYPVHTVDGDSTCYTIYGCVIEIKGNSYDFYFKHNTFTPEQRPILDQKNVRNANVTNFFASPKAKKEIEMKLTAKEEEYLEKAMRKAKKEALKEISAARQKNSVIPNSSAAIPAAPIKKQNNSH